MSQSSGGGTFTGVYHAFKEECNRYRQRKRIKSSVDVKMTKLYSTICKETNAEQITAERFAELLPEFDTFIFGGDGLLWLRLGVITDAANVVNFLIENNKKVLILTNDTTHSRKNHEKKLLEHRFNRKLNKECIITPGLLAADYITTNRSSNERDVYLIATGGIQDDISDSGFSVIGHGPDAFASLKDDQGAIFNIDISVKGKNVCAVVVGLDMHFNFKKLTKATNFLKNSNCLFLATNDSALLNPDEDIVIPDAGPIVDAVKKASAREPVILGKPYSSAHEYIKKRWNINESRTLMVCSTINADVMFAHNHGMQTLLILNNSHNLDQLEKMHQNQPCDSIGPNFYATSLSAILPPNK